MLQERLKKEPEAGAPVTPVPKNLGPRFDEAEAATKTSDATTKGTEATSKGGDAKADESGDECGVPVVKRLGKCQDHLMVSKQITSCTVWNFSSSPNCLIPVCDHRESLDATLPKCKFG